jgi:hypothetical protein
VTPASANISSSRSLLRTTRLSSDGQLETGAAADSALAWK